MRKCPIGIVLTESEHVKFMGELMEYLYKKAQEIGPDVFWGMIKRNQIQSWMEKNMSEWFDRLKASLGIDRVLLLLGKWECEIVVNGKQFYTFHRRVIDDLVEELKERLGI
jgi:hypothetical protein